LDFGIDWERGALLRLAVAPVNLRWHDEQIHFNPLLLLKRDRAEEEYNFGGIEGNQLIALKTRQISTWNDKNIGPSNTAT
jgi:hypothetical protein